MYLLIRCLETDTYAYTNRPLHLDSIYDSRAFAMSWVGLKDSVRQTQKQLLSVVLGTLLLVPLLRFVLALVLLALVLLPLLLLPLAA